MTFLSAGSSLNLLFGGRAPGFLHLHLPGRSPRSPLCILFTPSTIIESSMWTVECFQDPVSSDVALLKGNLASCVHSAVVLGRVPIASLLADASQQAAFQEGNRVARVALADFVARKVAHHVNTATQDGYQVSVEPLDKYISSRSRRGKNKTNGNSYAPFILERSDVWCNETDLHVVVRVVIVAQNDEYTVDEKKTDTTSALEQLVTNAATKFLTNCTKDDFSTFAMQHVACVVVQNKLRAHLVSIKAVAFVADGSILPRKSGASSLPMASPPAIPFAAPMDSTTRQSLKVEMGLLAHYLPSGAFTKSQTTLTLTGLVVPAGITLICGGGYHGKVRGFVVFAVAACFLGCDASTEHGSLAIFLYFVVHVIEDDCCWSVR